MRQFETVKDHASSLYAQAQAYLPNPIKSNIDSLSLLAKETFATPSAKAKDLLPDSIYNSIEFAFNFIADSSKSVLDRGLETAHKTKSFTLDTVNDTLKFANATQEFATQKVTKTYQIGQTLVSKATTTIQTNTPKPVLDFLSLTIAGVDSLAKQGPVEFVRPYLPAVVVEYGERSVEIVRGAGEVYLKKGLEAGGYIIHKVNGTVENIVSIPQVEMVILEVKRLLHIEQTENEKSLSSTDSTDSIAVELSEISTDSISTTLGEDHEVAEKNLKLD